MQALRADQAAGPSGDLSGELPADLQITPADDLTAALARCPLLATNILPTLADALAGAQAQALAAPRRNGPVLFKSCGAALWDLAAARCAVEALDALDSRHGPAPVTAPSRR